MEGYYTCIKCEFKTKKEESLKQHMKSKHAKVPNNDLIQQMMDQTQCIRMLENESMIKKELLQNSESEIVKAKTELELAKKSLKIAKESAKALQMELTSSKDSLKTAKANLEAERELNRKYVEETEQGKEVSEKVECSTQTDAYAETTKEVEVEIKQESFETMENSMQTDDPEKVVNTYHKEAKQDFKHIPCKYIHTGKGCRRGNSCWFSHNYLEKPSKEDKNKNQTSIHESKKPESKIVEDEGSNVQKLLIELIKLCISGKIRI